jgi:energy-coupling factor transporter ATP-binding protein EcfA2
MGELLGQRLVKEKLVTEEQVHKAIERQKLHGGRIGDNIIALGYTTLEELNAFLKKKPDPPKTIADTGLDLSFVADLTMKHILFTGEFTIKDLSESIKLPLDILDPILETLRRDQLVEVKGTSGYAKYTYKYIITDQGKQRATELFDICRYAGPAPVRLDEYKKMVECQTIENIVLNEEVMNKAFSHIVISDDILKRLGPAISSGKALFIYGPPGNGKTTIAEAIGQILPDTIYIPYSIIVTGQIINIYDPVNHISVEHEADNHSDKRWLLVKRPVVMVGGELTIRMLDLDFNPISKFYEAPLQMKSNNGLFVVDDFGRQLVAPHILLNRWMVPLERRIDFMALHTGMKFDIPFDQLVVFSTNIEPKELVDEAFLRRIRYKIKIDHPTEDEYLNIFKKLCESNEIEFDKEVYDYLLNNYYKRLNVKLNACHPRDILDHIIDDAHYFNRSPQLTKDRIDTAWQSYFVDM